MLPKLGIIQLWLALAEASCGMRFLSIAFGVFIGIYEAPFLRERDRMRLLHLVAIQQSRRARAQVRRLHGAHSTLGQVAYGAFRELGDNTTGSGDADSDVKGLNNSFRML